MYISNRYFKHTPVSDESAEMCYNLGDRKYVQVNLERVVEENINNIKREMFTLKTGYDDTKAYFVQHVQLLNT